MCAIMYVQYPYHITYIQHVRMYYIIHSYVRICLKITLHINSDISVIHHGLSHHPLMDRHFCACIQCVVHDDGELLNSPHFFHLKYNRSVKVAVQYIQYGGHTSMSTHACCALCAVLPPQCSVLQDHGANGGHTALRLCCHEPHQNRPTCAAGGTSGYWEDLRGPGSSGQAGRIQV